MLRKLKNFAHLTLAMIANFRYGSPAKRLKIIGVTGTDGKTTTSSMIYHILTAAGHKTAMITTVGATLNGQVKTVGFHVTTPSSFTIQAFLKEAADSGHEYAVIETSSHGIDQNRIWGISYSVAAITNITHEHLDYHASFEDYAETKFKFLRSARVAVVNVDDPAIYSLLKTLPNRVITYSQNSNSADYNFSKTPVEVDLFGTFNKMNALAAAAACIEAGIPRFDAIEALKSFKLPPGRQQMVHDGDFKVMVDFAHTPNAIENVLKEAKGTNPSRLIHLFGAPGRRDESKRPLMGEASSKYADVMIITADDPRDEVVTDVIAQIRKGVPSNFELGKNLFEIPDRREAIKAAISMAQPGDFIMLTGKGHEETLALKDQELPWNEPEIARSLISEIKKT